MQAYRRSRFAREDDVRYDQYRGLPSFHGVPIEPCELLGIGPGGLWRYNNGVDLFDAGARTGGSFDSGTRANTGEMFFINLKHYRVFMHPDWSPGFRNPFQPEQYHGVANWITWWLNTLCRARHTQGYLGLYDLSR